MRVLLRVKKRHRLPISYSPVFSLNVTKQLNVNFEKFKISLEKTCVCFKTKNLLNKSSKPKAKMQVLIFQKILFSSLLYSGKIDISFFS